jgi:hypothetical protein
LRDALLGKEEDVAGLKVTIETYEDEKRSVSDMAYSSGHTAEPHCSGRINWKPYKLPMLLFKPVSTPHKKPHVHSNAARPKTKNFNKLSNDSRTSSISFERSRMPERGMRV